MSDDDFEADLAEIRAFAAELREDAARERAAFANRDRSEEDALAAARRKGEHGPDWQRLQQRIDLRQTTLADVMNGVDLSPEARRVREALVARLPELRTQYAACAAGDDFVDMRAANERAKEELARTLAALAGRRRSGR